MPIKLIVCGLPEALSVTFNAADSVPMTVGLNVTRISQRVRAANMPGAIGQLLACEKSALFPPLMVMPLMDKSAWPLLARTTTCDALAVPWICVGKFN
jgi:hypothetical protein